MSPRCSWMATAVLFSSSRMQLWGVGIPEGKSSIYFKLSTANVCTHVDGCVHVTVGKREGCHAARIVALQMKQNG